MSCVETSPIPCWPYTPSVDEVFILLGCGGLWLGNWCPSFKTTYESRFQGLKYFDPSRWNHCIVSERLAPITRWYGATSKRTETSSTPLRKPKTRTVIVVINFRLTFRLPGWIPPAIQIFSWFKITNILTSGMTPWQGMTVLLRPVPKLDSAS